MPTAARGLVWGGEWKVMEWSGRAGGREEESKDIREHIPEQWSRFRSGTGGTRDGCQGDQEDKNNPHLLQLHLQMNTS